MLWARIALLAGVCIWGWSFVATRVALHYVTPIELLALRYVTALPVLGALIIAQRLRLEFTPRQRWQVLLGAAILTTHFLVQITGLQYTTATNTSWIIAATPLVMAVVAWLILRERLGFREIAGIAVATFGIVLLVSRGRLGSIAWLSSIGDWLVLGSAHTWAFYTVATRNLSRARSPLVVTFAMLLPSALVCTIYVAIDSDLSRLAHIPLDGVIAILFLGVLAMAFGQWFWQIGIRSFGAARAGLFLYLEPLATTALAVPYLHEPFGPFIAIGGLLVLAGVFIAQRRKRAVSA